MHSSSRFGRHKPTLSTTGPSFDDFPPPPTHGTAATPTANNDESVVPKESTKTSRFFKRMSNIGSKRKTTQSIASSNSPVSERGSIVPTTGTGSSKDKADMPPAAVVGDLNVQFPDSLVSHTLTVFPNLRS
jgi:hypothetical protein